MGIKMLINGIFVGFIFRCEVFRPAVITVSAFALKKRRVLIYINVIALTANIQLI